MSDKEFTKNDQGKTEFSLIDASWEEQIADVLSAGARKYSPWNWQKCEDPRRYLNACLRHLNAYRRGEWSDSDSGSPHIVHAAVNLKFLYWFEVIKDGNESPAGG